MSGPFKMKGSSFYGHGNQKRKDGMPWVQAAMGIAKQVGGMMSKKKEDDDSGTKYASPAKDYRTKQEPTGHTDSHGKKLGTTRTVEVKHTHPKDNGSTAKYASPAKEHGGAHHGTGTDWEHQHNSKVAHSDGAEAHGKKEQPPTKKE